GCSQSSSSGTKTVMFVERVVDSSIVQRFNARNARPVLSVGQQRALVTLRHPCCPIYPRHPYGPTARRGQRPMLNQCVGRRVSVTCLMPTLWPANTVLRLIFCRLKQMRPHVVTVAVLSWNG